MRKEVREASAGLAQPKWRTLVLSNKEVTNLMRCWSATLPVFTGMLLAAVPAAAQSTAPYVRHQSPRLGHSAPIPNRPQPATLTAEQQLAIAPVKWPAPWPAPRLPPGTVPTVPPRPEWMPQAGEYWGPFTDDAGGWGFMIGPRPAQAVATLPPSPAVPPRVMRAAGPGRAPAPAPPAPTTPVAGPVSPEGRMLVTYPDGNQVTWQFPMVQYSVRVNGLTPDGKLYLVDTRGRRGLFEIARNARVTVNGKPGDPKRLPAGARATARALRLAPAQLTVLDLTK